VLAFLFSDRLVLLLNLQFSTPGVQKLLAFMTIFVVTIFIGGFIGNMISKLTSAAGLRAADRALGAVFGVVRGLVIVTLVVMLTLPFGEIREYYSKSRLVPYLMVLADYFQNLLELPQQAELLQAAPAA